MIQDSVACTAVGAPQVTQAGETMRQIVSSVDHVTSTTREITTATSELSDAIEQVSTVVGHISVVVFQFNEDGHATSEAMPDARF